LKKIEIGDVVSPKADPYFYMTVIRVSPDDENSFECDFPDHKTGGRNREDFPAQALIIHENFGEDEDETTIEDLIEAHNPY